MRRLLLAFALVALTTGPVALAADPDAPHPHQGVIPPIEGAPSVPELSPEDEETLAEGKPVTKQEKTDGSAGRGIAVQDIHAPVETVWSRITSYDDYAEWVGGVYESEIYGTDGDRIDVRFIIGAMMIRVEYFVTHTYKPDEGYMTWTLDYSKESDLDDSVGFWRVMPHPTKEGWTRVYYSVEVKLKGWIPGWVETMLAKRGLTDATSWVKHQSEKAAGTGG